MKLVDNKGRLFGKFNIIDVMAVLFVILVLAVGAKFLYLTPENEVTANVDFMAEDVQSVDSLYEGKKLIEDNRTVGQIEKLTVVGGDNGADVYMTLSLLLEKQEDLMFSGQPVRLNQDVSLEFSDIYLKGTVTGINSTTEEINKTLALDLGTLTPSQIDKLKDSEIVDHRGEKTGEIIRVDTIPVSGKNSRVKISAALQMEKDKQLLYQKQKVKLGKTIDLDFSDFEKSAEIIRITSSSPEVVKKQVQVINYNVKPWEAEKFNVGDTEKNLRNKIIAEVVDKKVEPAQMVVVSDEGRVYERENPVNKDITLTLEVVAEKTPDSLLFHGSELKVGENMFFETGEYDFSGEITALK